jgi:hypothetical protein
MPRILLKRLESADAQIVRLQSSVHLSDCARFVTSGETSMRWSLIKGSAFYTNLAQDMEWE